VAAALLGIGIVTGLTAVNTAQAGAREAARQAWGTCAVRAEANAIEAAPWSDSFAYPVAHNVVLDNESVTGRGQGRLQVMDVRAVGVPGATVTVYKAWALSTTGSPADASVPVYAYATAPGQSDGYGQWCEHLLGDGS